MAEEAQTADFDFGESKLSDQADLLRWPSRLDEDIERDESARFTTVPSLHKKAPEMKVRWACESPGVEVLATLPHKGWVSLERHAKETEHARKEKIASVSQSCQE